MNGSLRAFGSALTIGLGLALLAPFGQGRESEKDEPHHHLYKGQRMPTPSGTELLTAFPDIHFDLTDIVIGPQGVCEWARVTGTHKAKWLGNEPTGETLTWNVVILFPWDEEQRLFKGDSDAGTGVHWRRAEARNVASRVKELVDSGVATAGEMTQVLDLGESLRQAQADLDGILAGLRRRFPHRYTAAMAAAIEARWQDRWEGRGVFEAPNPVGDLAGELGLSKSAIYHHVPSKEHLLQQALDEALDSELVRAREMVVDLDQRVAQVSLGIALILVYRWEHPNSSLR